MTMRELMSHTAGFDVSAAEAYQKVELTAAPNRCRR